jgi:hypothetical protein
VCSSDLKGGLQTKVNTSSYLCDHYFDSLHSHGIIFRELAKVESDL